MICKPCRTGGELNKRGLGLREEDKRRDAEAAFEQAKFFHDDCVGKTSCQCQHIVGIRMISSYD
jgi:hypothetical protein